MRNRITAAFLALAAMPLTAPSQSIGNAATPSGASETVAAAQGGAEALTTLEACLREAFANNLTLQSGKVAIERARELQGTAFDIEGTGVSIAQTPTTGGGPENALTVSQTFAFPTVYGAKRGKLRAETRLEEIRYELSRAELEREVCAAYYTLLYAEELERLYAAQDSVYARFLSIAEARLKSGEAGRLEQINARRLHEGNHIAMADAGRQADNMRLRLRQWLNTDKDIAPSETSLPVMDGDADGLGDFDPQASPLVRLSSQESVVAEKGLRLARQAFLPEISLAASTQMLLKGFNFYDIDRARFPQGNFMGAELGISVPLFFTARKSNLRAAKKEVERSRLRMEQDLIGVATDYDIARNDCLQARSRLDYYLSGGNEDARETSRIAQLSYEKGDIGYVEYVQNLQTALDLQVSYIEAVNAYNQAVISLRYIQKTL